MRCIEWNFFKRLYNKQLFAKYLFIIVSYILQQQQTCIFIIFKFNANCWADSNPTKQNKRLKKHTFVANLVDKRCRTSSIDIRRSFIRMRTTVSFPYPVPLLVGRGWSEGHVVFIFVVLVSRISSNVNERCTSRVIKLLLTITTNYYYWP